MGYYECVPCPLCSHTWIYETLKLHKTFDFPLKVLQKTASSSVKLLGNILSTSPNSRAALQCAIQLLALYTQTFLRLNVWIETLSATCLSVLAKTN